MIDVPSPVTDPSCALPQIELGGVRLHAISESQCVSYVLECLGRDRGGWIATANLDHMRRLRNSADFRSIYGGASVVVADGMPLVWAARLQGTPLPERVAGSDLIYSLTAGASATQRSVFFLGGVPGSADATAQKLAEKHPGLRVAGTCCPPLGFERDPEQMEALRCALKDAQPDIVFVALGSPKQEELISQMHSILPQAWWIGIGGSFCFVAGTIHRAPSWVQRIGFEWLHRLAQSPRRLGARYLWYGPPSFLWLILSGIRGRRASRRKLDAER
jgi:N-acetylglucosaminyldiphosphoundecaprenol N-acetyl-beta-D-mannosaminyltransferase